MEAKLEETSKNIVQNLMVIAQLGEYDKLRVTGKNVQIQPWSYFQWLRRKWGGDGVEQTKERIESLYDEACYIADVQMKLVDLNIVLVANKQQLTALENKVYWTHRQALDLLAEWLEKSLPKLALLHEKSYGGKETIFVMIEHKTRQKLEEIRSHSARLSEAYCKMNILSPLSAGAPSGTFGIASETAPLATPAPSTTHNALHGALTSTHVTITRNASTGAASLAPSTNNSLATASSNGNTGSSGTFNSGPTSHERDRRSS